MAFELQLASDTMTARVSSRGAEVTALCHRDHGDILWNGDPRWWNRTSPILFPVVGRSVDDRVKVGDATFPMPLHGFAHALDFMVDSADRSSCRLRLVDQPATRRHYPFAFVLDLAYRFAGETLHAVATIGNTGAVALPVGFGFHPGLRWPLARESAKEDHELVFATDDYLDVSRARDGLILPGHERIELAGRRLPLSERLFEQGAMVIRKLNSDTLVFRAPGAAPTIEVAFGGFSALGLWMTPGADFLCIEPWAGHGDPQGFSGDMFDKPGIAALSPGDRVTFRMSISVTRGG